MFTKKVLYASFRTKQSEESNFLNFSTAVGRFSFAEKVLPLVEMTREETLFNQLLSVAYRYHETERAILKPH